MLPAWITEAIAILNLKQLKKLGKCKALGWGTTEGIRTGGIQQAWLSTKLLDQSDELLVPSLPTRSFTQSIYNPTWVFLKTCCLTLKNKGIKSLCTFKSLPKAKCLPYGLPTALVFASVTNWGGLGCCCMQVDLVWTRWMDKCWERALDQPTHRGGRVWEFWIGLRPLACPGYIMPWAAFVVKAFN